MATEKKKIINILSHPPAYEFYRNKPRPKVHWETPDGNWVGIWGYDWPDQLGNEILKLTNEFKYEVWQPDIRADRIYSHSFENGLVHRLFPGRVYQEPLSLFRRKMVVSPTLVFALKSELGSNTLIQLNEFRGYFSYEVYKIATKVGFPVLVTGHGSTLLPLEEAKLARSPFTKLSLVKEHSRLRRIMHTIDYATDENGLQILRWSRFLGKKVDYLTMGCDFDFWFPRPEGVSRLKEFEEVHRNNKIIFLTVANFIDRKQLDKIILTFLALSDKKNYYLVIVGHGDAGYTNYLKELGRPLIEDKQLLFMDYTTGEKLREVYWSADIYLSMAISEGTSVAAIYALACGLPVITTEENGIADVLKENSAGLVLPPKDFQKWYEEISRILRGRPVRPLEVDVAYRYFSWPKVARRYIELYQELFKQDTSGGYSP